MKVLSNIFRNIISLYCLNKIYYELLRRRRNTLPFASFHPVLAEKAAPPKQARLLIKGCLTTSAGHSGKELLTGPGLLGINLMSLYPSLREIPLYRKIWQILTRCALPNTFGLYKIDWAFITEMVTVIFFYL